MYHVYLVMYLSKYIKSRRARETSLCITTLSLAYTLLFPYLFYNTIWSIASYSLMPKKKRPISSACVPETQSRKNPTLHDRLTILDWHHENGGNQSKTARHFKENGFPFISQSRVSAWLKDEGNMRARASTTRELTSKRVRTVSNPDFENALIIFVQQAESRGLALTGEVIRAAGAKFYDQLGIPVNERQKLSNGWLESFKERVGLRSFRFHGEAQSANVEHVEDERARLKSLLAGWDLCNVFNMDETALFYAMSPDRGLATTQHHGQKQSKVRLTLAFTANADGTERLPPLIIGRAKRPRCFQKKTGEQLGFNYHSNSRAWMTGDIFRQWLVDWDKQLRNKNRKILLLVDNFSGHNYDTRSITNIEVERFAPNMTSHVQPMDAGVIHCFKAHYRRHFLSRALDLFDDGADDIYGINQLQAMRMICMAWEDVSNETIAHCWNKTGILPINMDNHSDQAVDVFVLINNHEQETVLAKVNDCYKAIEHIQPNRIRLSIEELVSPAEENDSVALESLDDNEITTYVITNREMEQSILLSNDSDNEEQEPAMSVKDAIATIEKLEHFMELENGEEFRDASRKLTNVKRTLHERVERGQKQTTLNSFFNMI